ncbi:DinB family protein [Chitinophaga solisilvae]|uniref:DinB family protein n=1 Tax=Chitinophaga solisilvae TaxID=1233460 RepID=A0A3S1CZK7_9BACT|nr:DinB family protein [Chitinophaga solisilvae]NSL88177.1 DinB family protein [Chitinophaga solisilvae]
MKKIILLLAVAVFSAFTLPQQSLQEKDNAFLAQQLQQSKDSLLAHISGLSDAQLAYKPAADRWSIAECIEHIMMVEKFMMDAEKKMMEQPANPEKRKEIKITDDQLLKGVEDRSHKAKAPEFGQPKHAYTSTADLIKAFTEQRDQLIGYVSNTKDDMRGHVMDNPAFGPMDAYQLLLLDAAHTVRHTKQIDEVKGDAGFPK